MLGQLGPRGASSDAGAQRTTRDKYDASAGCSAAKGPGRQRDDRLFSSDDITILVHGKMGFRHHCDTRRLHATLPLTSTLGRLARVRIEMLSFENEKQQANDSAQAARKIEPHDDSITSVRHHAFSICVFFARAVVASLAPCQPLELAPRAAPRSRSCR